MQRKQRPPPTGGRGLRKVILFEEQNEEVNNENNYDLTKERKEKDNFFNKSQRPLPPVGGGLCLLCTKQIDII